MFQTDARQQGGVSAGVARLWQGRTSGAEPARSAPSYFPRSDGGEAPQAEPATAPDRAASSPADVARPTLTGAAFTGTALTGAPLPPRRPAEFGASGQAVRSGAPLDLSLFTIRSGL